ncbi:bifunctional protein GlmU-like isoform X2 [Heterodontus francisci]|uniref:bifunctional protein GlmU-like isoform X2 n=1 Tax=Heterodontus francisci TaxID=7792 RepID=UPI00355B014C
MASRRPSSMEELQPDIAVSLMCSQEDTKSLMPDNCQRPSRYNPPLGLFPFLLLAGPSSLSAYALRLSPGEEIVTSLITFVKDKKLKAPFIITCVGSVTKATLRLANAIASNTNEIIHLKENFEIVSLVGTLNEVAHLHITLADKDGRTIGGHVLGDLEVFTTAEIVIGECNGLEFTREMDERTGFPELVINSHTK